MVPRVVPPPMVEARTEVPSYALARLLSLVVVIPYPIYDIMMPGNGKEEMIHHQQ